MALTGRNSSLLYQNLSFWLLCMILTNRHKTLSVAIGDVHLGDGAPIVVQSMTNTDTANIEATVEQIKLLSDAGSELVRVTVNNEDSAKAIPYIVERLSA